MIITYIGMIYIYIDKFVINPLSINSYVIESYVTPLKKNRELKSLQ